MKKMILSIFAVLLISAGCNVAQAPTNTPSPITPSALPAPTAKSQLMAPISNALSRVTKKPFGIYITPATSPVQPEKFMGFHTGVDFETFDNEQNVDVSIYAACDGKLLLKKYATGYGGVAVQSCKLDSSDVTIIYGHLRLSSITPNTGGAITAGQKIAVLGTGYSTETDGERKHLHFGIHKGASVVLLGYVQKQADLSGWIDAIKYLK